MIVIRRGVVQTVGDGAIRINKGVLFGDGSDGMPPKQDGGIPWVSAAIWIVQIFEKVAAHDPVFSGVRADTVEIADAGAVIVGRVAGVFEPAIFDDAVVHAQSSIHIGWI